MNRTLRALAVVLVVAAVAPASHGTTVVPPSFTQLAAEADYIIRARVTKIAAERRESGGRSLIYTRIWLEVREVIAGNPPAVPELLMLGGQLDDEELSVEGAPRFAVGDEDILFVHGNGANFHPLYALGHGRYPVRRAADGTEYVLRDDGVPLRDVAEVSLPLRSSATSALPAFRRSSREALGVAAFVAAIRAERLAHRRHAK